MRRFLTKGFTHLTGKMGVLVQPRTKGPGHGSISRAFYARAHFVAHIIGLEAPSGMVGCGALCRWSSEEAGLVSRP